MKIGIDIGGVIIAPNDHGPDTSFITKTDVDAIKSTPATEGVMDAIRTINREFDNNVWIVSKCKENMQRKSRKWLKHHEFYEQTELHPSRIIFCYFRHDKHIIAEGLGLTHFIDDRRECLASMKTVTYRYLFGPQRRNVPVPDEMVHVPTWADVLVKLRLF